MHPKNFLLLFLIFTPTKKNNLIELKIITKLMFAISLEKT